MDKNGSDPRFLVIGLAIGGLMMAAFLVLAAMFGVRSGFYGAPPNGTWYKPAPGHAAEPAATQPTAHH